MKQVRVAFLSVAAILAVVILLVTISPIGTSILHLFDTEDQSAAISGFTYKMVSYYPMDEGQGTTVNDVTSYNNDLTLNGPTWTAGIEGKALWFDGNNDIAVTNLANDVSLNNSFSIATWVKPQQTTERGSIVFNSNFELRLEGMTPQFLVRDADADQANAWDAVIISASSIEADQWSHLVASYNNNTRELRLYVNGVLQSSVQTTGGDGIISASLRGTTISHSVNTFQGTIDEVRVYNRVFWPKEVTNLFEAVAIPSEPTPVPTEPLPTPIVPAPDTADCGEPTLDGAVDSGVFIWKSCTNDTWSLRLLAGKESKLVAKSTLTNSTDWCSTCIKNVSIESGDTVSVSGKVLNLTLNVSAPWSDGVDITTTGSVCLSSDTSVRVGPDKTLMSGPFVLETLSSCGTSENPIPEPAPIVPTPDPDEPLTDVRTLGYVSVLDYGADPNGIKDSTVAIRNAVKAGYDRGTVTFFPEGTYLVSDTIEMFTPSDKGYQLVGSTHGGGVTIKLKDGSAGFGACSGYPSNMTGCVLKASLNTSACVVLSRPTIKPVFHFWRDGKTCKSEPEFADGSQTYGNVLKHINIVLGKNPGAVATRHNGAENALMEDITINATGGFAGLYEMAASGAVLSDIEIIGGQHAIYAPVSRGGADLIIGLTLKDQLRTPIYFEAPYPLTLVGFDITLLSGSLIETSAIGRSQEHLALIDGVLRASSDNGKAFVTNGDRSVYLKNVYVQGAKKVVSSSVDGSSLTIPDTNNTYLISEYSFAGYGTKYGDYSKLINGRKTNDTYYNGQTTTNKLLTVSTKSTVPSDLVNRHILPANFCDVEDPQMVNVKTLGARGNGVTDDSNAIQNALNQARDKGTNKVIMPSGTYLVSKTLTLPANVQLCSVGRGIASITTPQTWAPSLVTPVIQTENSATGRGAVSDLSVQVYHHNVFPIHWRLGASSVVHRFAASVDNTLEGTQYARNRILISDNGGGKWYGIVHGNGYWSPQDPALRTMKITGTSQPLSFYVFHTQYVKPSGNPMVEVRDSSNVNFYGGKHEFLGDFTVQGDRYPAGTVPFVLGIYNSKNIGVYGVEGRSCTDVGDGVLEVTNSNNVTVVNMGQRPTSVYLYPEDQWYQVKEILNGITTGIKASSWTAFYKRS